MRDQAAAGLGGDRRGNPRGPDEQALMAGPESHIQRPLVAGAVGFYL